MQEATAVVDATIRDNLLMNLTAKIRIKNGKVEINGKKAKALLNYLEDNSKNVFNQIQSQEMKVVSVRGQYHQAVFFEENSNFAAIFTSKETIRLKKNNWLRKRSGKGKRRD